MLIRQIALLTKTKKVPTDELMRVSAALQRQVSRDLAPIWTVDATVDCFHAEADVPPGYWKIRVMDKTPQKNAGGFHFDKNGQPEADVVWSPNWSLAASHECLEMLVDPFGRNTVAGPSPHPKQGRVSFLVEISDPCEAPACAYRINTGTTKEILVSDFITPEYFAPVKSSGVRYSFRGSIRAPRQVLTGGYLSWSNPADYHIWQLFGPAQIGKFVDHGRGTLDRTATDGHSRSLRKTSKRIVLATNANNCNLVPDAVGGVVHGTANVQTTVQIKDSTGKSIFHSISYNQKQIGSDVPSASFTIASGDNDLTFIYAAPIAGDDINIVDPCGTVLDAFPNDPGNPRVSITVSA